jgi:hypothetical protein
MVEIWIHPAVINGGEGYTLRVHTAGGGKGFTLQVHTAGDREKYTCSVLTCIVCRWNHYAHPHCRLLKGILIHVHKVDCRKGYNLTSTLLVSLHPAHSHC